MKVDIDRSHWWLRVAASFRRFTVLPVGGEASRSAGYAVRSMEFWPLVGWLMGGVAAACIIAIAPVAGMMVAAGVAIAVRAAITGLSTEHGLSAFVSAAVQGKKGVDGLRATEEQGFDAIGSVAVIAVWLALWWTLSTMTPLSAALTIFASDAYARMVAGQATLFMPCATARLEFGQTPSYVKFTTAAAIAYFVMGMLPMAVLLWLGRGMLRWDLIIFCPCLVMYFLYLLSWRRFGGYTDRIIKTMQALAELASCIAIRISF